MYELRRREGIMASRATRPFAGVPVTSLQQGVSRFGR
jgi:hypothetical protein